jgi:hypothetical protein
VASREDTWRKRGGDGVCVLCADECLPAGVGVAVGPALAVCGHGTGGADAAGRRGRDCPRDALGGFSGAVGWRPLSRASGGQASLGA